MREKILVVDGDVRIRRLITRILGREGYQVESAASGHEGLADVRTYQPDLVILDLSLPDVDSVDVCRHIRTFSSVPVLFVSVSRDRRTIDRALACGNDYILKPFERVHLLARVQALLQP